MRISAQYNLFLDGTIMGMLQIADVDALGAAPGSTFAPARIQGPDWPVNVQYTAQNNSLAMDTSRPPGPGNRFHLILNGFAVPNPHQDAAQFLTGTYQEHTIVLDLVPFPLDRQGTWYAVENPLH